MRGIKVWGRAAAWGMALLLMATTTGARGGEGAVSPLRVAASSDLQPVFSTLAKQFAAQGGGEVVGIFDSSRSLGRQIAMGAAYALFLSSDEEAAREAATEAPALLPPQRVARGALVLWSAKPWVLSQWRTLLLSPEVRQVAMVNPQKDPHGQSALELLRASGLEGAVQPKRMLGETLAQVADMVEGGAAELGFVDKARLLALPEEKRGQWFELPPDLAPPIPVTAVLLPSPVGGRTEEALAFYQFLASPAARPLWRTAGYQAP
ncbi:MAG: molybdate ABC transporter substrate-binding protein [Magnetococcales bacterium]|nr:molybdate ABC transporter substrate-binding protein [Magnetococcales bacterium]